MAFVKETGAGLSNSNGYVDETYFVDYHTDRGNDLVDPSTGVQWTTTQINSAIVRASDYIDTRFVFVGLRLLVTQAMEWPRSNAFYNSDGRIALGVPPEVEQATAEYALRALTAVLAPDPTYDATNARVVRRREKVGPIEEEYEFGADGSVANFRAYPAVDKRLHELVLTGQYVERV